MKFYLERAALALALFAAPAFSETMTLTVDDAVRIALENSASVRRGEISLEAKRRERNFSWNSASPSATASASYSTALPDEEGSKDTVSAGVTVKASLSTNLYTSIEAARIAFEQQGIEYAQALRDVELSARKSFYSLLCGMESVAIQERSLETAKAQYESNQAKYSRGTLSRLDVLSAQVAYQNSSLELEQAREELESEMDEFKRALGMGRDDELRLSGNFDGYLNLGRVSIEGMEGSPPSIESLEKQLEAARNSLLASRFSAYGPTLSATYSYARTSRDSGETWSDGGTLTLGASIPLDGILPWSRAALDIDSRRDVVRDLEIQLEDARSTLEVKVDACLRKIRQNKASLGLRRSSAEVAEAAYGMTLDSYNHGTKDLLSLQSARDSLLSSRLALIREAYLLAASILDLEQLLGLEFGSLSKKMAEDNDGN